MRRDNLSLLQTTTNVKPLEVFLRCCMTVLLLVCSHCSVEGFTIQRHGNQNPTFGFRIGSPASGKSSALPAVIETTAEQQEKQLDQLRQSVQSLKRVLEREYISFFNPMVTECYATNVTFDDPLTSLAGVSAYKSNVDMLGGRTWLGKLLFRDASIVLHSILGGDVQDLTTISDITTRWTLRFTFQLLPWTPTAVFTGVSIYHVAPKLGNYDIIHSNDTFMGVQIQSQQDYWDSINLMEGGKTYHSVDKSKALLDFLDQLNPNKVFGIAPPSSSMEVPYQLLRRGGSYEVRRYPQMVVATVEYDRRDEGYALLGSVVKNGLKQLSPAIMEVISTASSSQRKKTMSWPLYYQKPGKLNEQEFNSFRQKAAINAEACVATQTVPEQVVAVRTFDDALTEAAVRANDQQLRRSLQRDGLVVADKYTLNDCLCFAQYDAVYSLGKRRSEVWITLKESGHLW